LMLIVRLYLLTYFIGLISEVCKPKVRNNMCCSKSITRPTPNSIAEKIKKKKVRDSRLILS
jgi:hypothetical protein